MKASFFLFYSSFQLSQLRSDLKAVDIIVLLEKMLEHLAKNTWQALFKQTHVKPRGPLSCPLRHACLLCSWRLTLQGGVCRSGSGLRVWSLGHLDTFTDGVPGWSVSVFLAFFKDHGVIS